MPIDELNFKAMLTRAALLGGKVNALDNRTYSDVMEAVNARLRDRWHFPAPPAGQRALVSDVIELLGSPRLSPRQADRLQRAFRGT